MFREDGNLLHPLFDFMDDIVVAVLVEIGVKNGTDENLENIGTLFVFGFTSDVS